MNSMGTFHHTFSEAGTYVFQLTANPEYEFQVKNMTTGNISVSYGAEVDTDNDAYMYMLPKTAELMPPYKEKERNKDVLIAVSAEGTGVVEIRIID